MIFAFPIIEVLSDSGECIIPDDILTQLDPPDDEHLLLETCRRVK
jgi:hypothetical protein